MATWNPATASCDHPEDLADMIIPVAGAGGGRSFTGGGGSRGGGASCRGGRRLGARARVALDASEGGGDEDRSWKRDGDSGGTSIERRTGDSGGVGTAAGSGGGGGRGRGRSKKEDVVWVQCDKCLRWRKLALGMLLEDLPDKW